MSEERPEYCKVCGAPETWCTCLVDQKEELTLKFAEKAIEHMRKIATKATPRPWFANVFAEQVVEINTNATKKIFPKTKKAVSIVHWVGFDSSSFSFSGQVANANLIVSAVNTHEAALTMIEQQRAENARLREALEKIGYISNLQVQDGYSNEIANIVTTTLEGGEE